MGAFIHPLTDWGFKRIFGDKELLMDFLNSLLEGERVITDLQYMNTEQLAERSDGRKTVYDLYCKTDTGEYIIVEMQNSQQAFFKDRAMIDKHTGKVFNNKFRQIYIELPRFMKSEADCNSFLEYWIYNLVNMNNLKEISFKDRKAIFDKLERLASQANLTEEERARLEEDWKNYNDYFNTIDFAKEEGRTEGEIKKNLENAQKMKDMGLSLDIITQVTGLPPEEIEKL